MCQEARALFEFEFGWCQSFCHLDCARSCMVRWLACCLACCRCCCCSVRAGGRCVDARGCEWILTALFAGTETEECRDC
jgi:hypothetical protein